MRWRSGLLIASTLMAGYAAWSAVSPFVHVRYRLTIEVSDGHQKRVGSSVIDVTYSVYPDRFVFLGGPDTHPRPRGYAATVDLGKKGLLFVTFIDAERSPAQQRESNTHTSCALNDIGCVAFAAYGVNFVGEGFYSREKAALRQLLGKSGLRDVPFSTLPQLARFADPNDPETLVPVSPDNLAAAFGPETKLTRATLELTDDPVTPMPAIWPQWLKTSTAGSAILKVE